MTEVARQSTLVTVLAWLALVLSGLSTVTGLLQSIFVLLAMPVEPMTPSEAVGVPPFIRFLFDNFHWFVISSTVFWATTFACALGLLRRREWGRQGFIAILVLGVIGVAVVAILQQTMMGEVFKGAEDVPADAATMLLFMRVASGIFALIFVAGFTWLVAQLRSQRVRAEFVTPPNGPLQPTSGG